MKICVLVKSDSYLADSLKNAKNKENNPTRQLVTILIRIWNLCRLLVCCEKQNTPTGTQKVLNLLISHLLSVFVFAIVSS